MSCMLAVALLLLGGAAAQIPDIVIHLDGSNFEHDTQAATGQTTGHWFVLFNAQTSNRYKQASKLWDDLAQDEDKQVILAEVDLDAEQNLFLARRFSMVQPPSAVLFRDRKMYVYPGPVTEPGSADKLREFCQGGYESVVCASKLAAAWEYKDSYVYVEHGDMLATNSHALQAAQEVPGARRIPTPQDVEQARKSQQTYTYVGLGLVAVGLLIRWYMQQQSGQRPGQGSNAATQAQRNADPLAPSSTKKAT